jgi:hypothetical protein
MNSVGRADGNEDPLAQLKAEAHEAMQHQDVKKKLTPEEIEALETGNISNSDGSDIFCEAAMEEEEANLKAMQRDEVNVKKPKKPWWRFGI